MAADESTTALSGFTDGRARLEQDQTDHASAWGSRLGTWGIGGEIHQPIVRRKQGQFGVGGGASRSGDAEGSHQNSGNSSKGFEFLPEEWLQALHQLIPILLSMGHKVFSPIPPYHNAGRLIEAQVLQSLHHARCGLSG